MTTALATLTSNLADRFKLGDNCQDLMVTLRQTAFKGNVSDAQMTALMLVAQQYGLNPWTKEIYAFPDKNNGIVPVVGVDGWSRIMNEHLQFDGMEFKQDDDSCTCIIYRKDRGHPISVTEYMSECKRSAGPWLSHPKRMLRHKTLIQAARLAFGFVGIYDQDEAERIVEVVDGQTGEVAQRKEKVTPQSAAASSVPNDFDKYEADVLPVLQEAAKVGVESLAAEFAKLEKSQNKSALWTKHSKTLKATAEQADNTVDAEVV